MSQIRQGPAGTLIDSLLFLSSSFYLGFADLTAVQTTSLGPERSYHVAFCIGVACAIVKLVVTVGFVRIEKAGSGLTADEKEESSGMTADEKEEKGKVENIGISEREGTRLQ